MHMVVGWEIADKGRHAGGIWGGFMTFNNGALNVTAEIGGLR